MSFIEKTMMENFKTEQEVFWAGSFGSNYISRNKSEKLLASNVSFFSRIFKSIDKISSCLEFGANIGMNLRAIQLLLPNIAMKAIEINAQACIELSKVIGKECVFQESILDYQNYEKFDLVLVKTVLIHINPEMLSSVYQKLYEASSKYILVCEYYNPAPVTINYRGHDNRLFKRDFAGELMDKYSNLKLLDYGFVYKRDVNFPQDDINWFLLEKH